MGTGRGGDPQDTDRRMAEPLWGHNALLLIRFKMLVGHDGRGASFRGRAPVFAASDSNGRSGLWSAGGGELVAVSPKFVRLHRLLGVPPWPKGAGAGNGAVDPKFVSPVGGGAAMPKGLGLLTKPEMTICFGNALSVAKGATSLEAHLLRTALQIVYCCSRRSRFCGIWLACASMATPDCTRICFEVNVVISDATSRSSRTDRADSVFSVVVDRF